MTTANVRRDPPIERPIASPKFLASGGLNVCDWIGVSTEVIFEGYIDVCSVNVCLDRVGVSTGVISEGYVDVCTVDVCIVDGCCSPDEISGMSVLVELISTKLQQGL